MQAILTKYHGPGNKVGTRVSASAAAGRRFYPWDDALNVDENHNVAARLFAQEFSWKGSLAHGVLASGDYVHVFVGK